MTLLRFLLLGGLPAAAQHCATAEPAETVQWNTTANKTLFYVIQPSGSAKGLPVVAFMHGTASLFAMYSAFVHRVASEGYVVVYPFIESPEADHHFWVTNTNGEYLLRAMDFARAASRDATSRIFGADASTFAVMGHSMGGTCTIMAAAHKLPEAKVAVALHPGICGPFGPPPSPNTWLPADLQAVTARMPLVMVSARNDAAFWPAPHTAEHEEGCFKQAVPEGPSPHGAALLVFSAEACAEDHAFEWADGGHDCVMKTNSAEQPWPLVALKLYLQHGGAEDSECYHQLWGSGAGTAAEDANTDLVLVHPPRSSAPSAASFVV